MNTALYTLLKTVIVSKKNNLKRTLDFVLLFIKIYLNQDFPR